MPCTAPARGTRAGFSAPSSPPADFVPATTTPVMPFNDAIQNNPCGLPTLLSIGGIDTSAASLCRFHWLAANGSLVASSLDSSTALLLHCDGTNASTAFPDYCGHTMTAAGNAQVSTAQSKFSGASALFDGTGDSISTPDSPDFDLAGGDFTIDAWVRFASLATNSCIAAKVTTSVTEKSFQLYWATSNNLVFSYSVDGTTWLSTTASWTPVVNTWYHVAVVRQGANLMLFVNGTQVGSTYAIGTAVIRRGSAPVYLGIIPGGVGLNGYLDEIRISKTARWTSAFTPPTGPYN